MMIMEEIIGPSVIYFVDELDSEKELQEQDRLRIEYEPISAGTRARLLQMARNKLGMAPEGYALLPDYNDVLREANIKIFNLQSADKKAVATYENLSLLKSDFAGLLILLAGRKVWNRQNGIKDNGDSELKNYASPSSAQEKAISQPSS
jgi:hypothetical protein